jgi:hypothetical protein
VGTAAIPSSTQPHSLPPHTLTSATRTPRACQVAFSLDGKFVISADGGSALRLWNLEASKLVIERRLPSTEASRDAPAPRHAPRGPAARPAMPVAAARPARSVRRA